MIAVEIDNEIRDPRFFGLDQAKLRVELANETLTLRELISGAVAAHLALQKALHGAPEPKTKFLDQAQIEMGLRQGKVALSAQPEPDVADSARRGCEAFSAGEFQVVVDGIWTRNLDDQITLHADSKVVFMRLIPLQGG